MKQMTVVTAIVLLALLVGASARAQDGSIVAWGDNSYGECNVPSSSIGFVAIASGTFHGLGIQADSSIVAWGRNISGQCNVPWPNTGFVAAAAGDAHSLGLKADGTIVAWGGNYSGECDVPAPNANFVGVASGVAHGVGLKSDGTVVVWGNNDYGQCSLPSPNGGFVAIAGGYFHNLGLKSDGSIVAWGSNTDMYGNYRGQCDVPAPNANFVAIAAGEFHSLGLKSDGSIVAWGWNGDWQCNVPAPNTDFVAIAAGRSHSMGLKANGLVVAWGAGGNGQTNVPGTSFGSVAIAAGAYYSMGLKSLATLTGACCDGSTGSCTITTEANCSYQWLGANVPCNPTNCPVPPVGACCRITGACMITSESACVPPGIWQGEGTPCNPSPCPPALNGSIVGWGNDMDGQYNIPTPNSEFVAMAPGWYHTLGLKSDGSIVAWGGCYYDQCAVPEPNSDFVAVASGLAHSLGLKSDGTIVAWGDNSNGQCTVPAPNGGFVAIAAGWYYSLGLKSNGTIVAWGDNSYGQGTVPAPNAGFAAISAGAFHALGLKANGTVVAWGYNGMGACNVPEPNTGYLAVAGGGYHSLGLKSGGTIAAWGWNYSGECDVPAPNTGFVSVAAGYDQSLGLKSDGTIAAWGQNLYGQRDVPAPNAGFRGVAAGGYYSLGLTAPPLCTGLVYRDDDGDCLQDPGEPGLAGWTVVLDPGGHAATTKSDGGFFFAAQAPGRYTAHVIPYPNWDVPCPASAEYVFDVVGTETVAGLDFGTLPIPGVHDLSISVAGGPARRGFTKTYSASLRNIGSESETSTTATLVLPPEVVYIDCSDAGSYDAPSHTVTWTASMAPGETLVRSARVEIPLSLPLGTPITASAEIQTTNADVHPANNLDQETQTVTGSWDPNDKWVTPTQDLPLDGLLTYQINFQNVGTDSAFTVVVRDTLDTNLDMATVAEGAASHPHVFRKTGRELRWTFPNIGLPDSTTSPSGSIGFIKFTVRPVAGLPNSTILTNRASIYFDFNDPVMTNSVFTTFVAEPAEVENPTATNTGTILVGYTNPYRARGPIVLAGLPGRAVEVNLYDVSGRLISHLFDGRLMQGRLAFSWDGRTDSGAPAGSGIYYLDIRGERIRMRRALVMIR